MARHDDCAFVLNRQFVKEAHALPSLRVADLVDRKNVHPIADDNEPRLEKLQLLIESKKSRSWLHQSGLPIENGEHRVRPREWKQLPFPRKLPERTDAIALPDRIL